MTFYIFRSNFARISKFFINYAPQLTKIRFTRFKCYPFFKKKLVSYDSDSKKAKYRKVFEKLPLGYSNVAFRKSVFLKKACTHLWEVHYKNCIKKTHKNFKIQDATIPVPDSALHTFGPLSEISVHNIRFSNLLRMSIVYQAKFFNVPIVSGFWNLQNWFEK